MEELADWSGPLGNIAQAALRKTRPHAVMRDYVARDTRRDNTAVRSLVGTVVASGLADFKRGRFVPTEQLLSHVGPADAMRDACWEAMVNNAPEVRLPDGSHPMYGDEIDEYPFIGVALEGHPVTLGRWDATNTELAIYRVVGAIGMGGTFALLPLLLALVGVFIIVVIPLGLAYEALVSVFRRRR